MATLSRGSVFRRPDSPRWFIQFYLDGKRYREPSGTEDREMAVALLGRRLLEDEKSLGRRLGRNLSSPAAEAKSCPSLRNRTPALESRGT